LDACRDKHAQYGASQIGRGKDLECLGERTVVAVLRARLVEHFGFVDCTADVKDKERRQEADPEHRSPSHVRRHNREEQREQQRGHAPSNVPRRLHGSHRSTSVFGADDLAHEDGASGPFATKAETLEGAADEQFGEAVCETAKESEEGKPNDRNLKHAHAAKPITEHACDPTAQRGYQKSRRPQ
jgi:hypothetical protein